MIEWLDRFLNRIIFLLIGVAGLIAMFQAMSSPRPPPIRELGLDSSALLSVMNPSCYRVAETLAFVRACADVPEGETGVACPLEAPEWVRFRPETSTMADLLVEQLEHERAAAEAMHRLASLKSGGLLGDVGGVFLALVVRAGVVAAGGQALFRHAFVESRNGEAGCASSLTQ